MRCAMAAFLAVGLMLGVYGCTQAQRDAAKSGAIDGATEAPANPPAGAPWDQFLLYYLAYLAGTTTKKGLGMAKDKLLKKDA